MRAETRHSITLGIGTGATAALSLAYSVYTGRVLGPAAYADFAAALVFAYICNIALGPINGTVARFSAQYAARGEYGRIRGLHRATSRWVALYGIGALVIAVLAVKALAVAFHFRSVLPLLVAYAMVYLTLLLSVGRGVLRGVQNFTQYNVNTISEAALRIAVGVGLLAVVRSAAGGLSAYLVALVAALVLASGQLREVWRGHAPSNVDVAAVRRFTIPMFVMMATTAGFESIDMLVVKRYFGASDGGVYGAAYTVARSISVVATPFTVLLLPLLAGLHEQGRSLAGAFGRVCGYFVLAAAVPLGVFAIWATELMTLLYGEAYGEAAPLLLPLAAARLVGYLGAMIALSHASTGRFRFLWVYVPLLGVQAAVLVVWHGSLAAVVTGVLWVQAGTVLVMLGLAVGTLRR